MIKASAFTYFSMHCEIDKEKIKVAIILHMVGFVVGQMELHSKGLKRLTRYKEKKRKTDQM